MLSSIAATFILTTQGLGEEIDIRCRRHPLLVTLAGIELNYRGCDKSKWMYFIKHFKGMMRGQPPWDVHLLSLQAAVAQSLATVSADARKLFMSMGAQPSSSIPWCVVSQSKALCIPCATKAWTINDKAVSAVQPFLVRWREPWDWLAGQSRKVDVLPAHRESLVRELEAASLLEITDYTDGHYRWWPDVPLLSPADTDGHYRWWRDVPLLSPAANLSDVALADVHVQVGNVI